MAGDQVRVGETLKQLTSPDSEYVREPKLRGWTLADKGWFPTGAALIAWSRPGFEIVVIHGGRRELGAIDVWMCAPGEGEQIGIDPLSVPKLDPHRLLPYLAGEPDLPRNREWSHEQRRWTFAELLDSADQLVDELGAVFSSPESVSETKTAVSMWVTASNRRRRAVLDDRRSEVIALLDLVGSGRVRVANDGLRRAAERVARSPETAEWLIDFSLHQRRGPLLDTNIGTYKWELTESGEIRLRDR